MNMEPLIESANETMWRRIEGTRRGPPILMALADGAEWTTPELTAYCKRYDRRLYGGSTYEILMRYVAKGLVRKVAVEPRLYVKVVPVPRLPARRHVDHHQLAKLLGVHRSTVWEMRTSGRLPVPDCMVPGQWTYWRTKTLRRFFETHGGVVRRHRLQLAIWQITPEGLLTVKGCR